MNIQTGHYNHKFCRRWFVKILQPAKRKAVLDTKMYIYRRWLKVRRGDTAYQVTIRVGRFEFLAMMYHKGTTVRGFRFEFSTHRRKPCRS